MIEKGSTLKESSNRIGQKEELESYIRKEKTFCIGTVLIYRLPYKKKKNRKKLTREKLNTRR